MFMGAYLYLNPSYEKSLEAKYYYETGNYKEALVLANEAFSLDVYNRMASTILAQSKIALKYVAYINDAKKYIKQIDNIATHSTISDADRAKIRLMCEVMIGSYKKLAPSVVTDNELVNSASNYYLKFEKLLEKVNR
jgi:tetratricopeptide (TPR) repeat protein